MIIPTLTTPGTIFRAELFENLFPHGMVRDQLVIAGNLFSGVEEVRHVGGVVIHGARVPLSAESHGGGDEVDGSDTWVSGHEQPVNFEQRGGKGAAGDLHYGHHWEQDPGTGLHQESLSSFGHWDGVGEAPVI